MASGPALDHPLTTVVEVSGGEDAKALDPRRHLSPDQRTSPSVPHSGIRLRSKCSFTSYHKPIRSDTPRSTSTPSASQQEKGPPSSIAPTDPGLDIGDIGIGMALGSPTHPPNYAMAPWPSFIPTVTTTVESLSSQRDDPSRPKPRKWGIFSRSGSKKGKASSPRSQDDSTSSRSASPIQYSLPQREQRPQDARDAVFSPRNKPLPPCKADASLAARIKPFGAGLKRRGIITPRARGVDGKTGVRFENTQDCASHSSASSSAEHLLDINIPDVTMERYSVMFGHLIAESSATSLLARRQASRDRINPLLNVDASSKRAVPLTPFPHIRVPGQHGSPTRLDHPDVQIGRLLSPRQRSNTLPSSLYESTQTNLDTAGSSRQKRRDLPLHVASSTRWGATSDASLPEERPRLISKFHRRSSSDGGFAHTPLYHAAGGSVQVEAESPNSYAIDTGVQTRTKPSILSADDSSMRTKTKSPSSGSAISLQTWNTAHPLRSTPRYAEVPASADCFPPAFVRSGSASSSEGPSSPDTDISPSQDPVEISIARQISVSRRQHALLEPLQRQNSLTRHASEKKPTPRLINPRREPILSPALQRTSERIVLEG